MTTLVLAGGPERPRVVELPAGARVIAADGGVELARELGLQIDLAVGDLDSAPDDLEMEVERHPADKDASDLELALREALRSEREQILVLGGTGGRIDHLLGGLLLLAAEQFSGVRVDAQLGPAAVHVLRGERLLTGEPGEVISLFAVHGPAVGVVTEGLRYPLRGELLEPGSTRGLSNVFVAREARIALEGGVLLAVKPSGSVTAASSGRAPT
jgi:thiamine pyrophosphokinase